MLFSTLGAFLCRYWTTTKWKCRISKYYSGRKQMTTNFFFLFKLGLSSSEFISRRRRLYLTKWAKAWNNRDKGSKNAKLVLFYWCFRRRCHLAILDALIWGARASAGTAFVPACLVIGYLFLISPDFFRSSTKLLQSILHHFSRFMLHNKYILTCFIIHWPV